MTFHSYAMKYQRVCCSRPFLLSWKGVQLKYPCLRRSATGGCHPTATRAHLLRANAHRSWVEAEWTGTVGGSPPQKMNRRKLEPSHSWLSWWNNPIHTSVPTQNDTPATHICVYIYIYIHISCIFIYNVNPGLTNPSAVWLGRYHLSIRLPLFWGLPP